MVALKRTKANKLRYSSRKKLIEQVKRLIGKNYNDVEICEALEIHTNLLSAIKSDIITVDKAYFEQLTSADVYSDYLHKSKQMVKRLHQIQVKFRNKGQWTALVAAIKQEKDIYDSCIKHGQDFGFIEKKATTMEVSGEFNLSTMSDAEMKREIAKQMNELNRLASGNVIEMRPEVLDAAGESVKYLPAEITGKTEKTDDRTTRKEMKIKTKVTLKRNV